MAIGPDLPPAPGDWGFFAPGHGLRGWWQRSQERLCLVIANEGDSTFTGDLQLPFAPTAGLTRILSGPTFTVRDGSVGDLVLPRGGLLTALLEER